MNIERIRELLNGEVVCTGKEHEVEFGFASDLMSDVLALCDEKVVLITGLANLQTIRTAEMSGIDHIIFVRGKKISEVMLKVAKENQMTLMETSGSMFKTCSILFNAGLRPCF